MEDRGTQDRIGSSGRNCFTEMLQGSGATLSYYRDRNSVCDGFGELDVVTVVGAIPVHAREQNLAGASLDRFLGPADGVASIDALAAAVDVDAPAVAPPLGIYGNHYALGAEMV